MAGDRASPAGGPRVLAWPAFRKQAANPHAALLAGELIAAGVRLRDWTPWRALARPGELWHLHHPETAALLGLLWLARLRGIRILWTIHDLGSNDALHPRLESWFWRGFVPAVDAVIHLSEGGRRLALARFPALADRPGHLVPHGHYRDAYPGAVPRAAARQRLGLAPEVPVLLHFGLLRPYKNVPQLIRVFRALPASAAVLLVAGRPFDAAVEREVRQAAAGAPNLRLELRWVPPDEVQSFFAASDLVVLPYRRILNSGAALLALTFGRPLLVPDLGAMRDLQVAYGADWIRLYAGELSAAELAAAIAWARSTPRGPLDLAGADWRELAGRTRTVYQELTGPPPTGWAARRARIDEAAR